MPDERRTGAHARHERMALRPSVAFVTVSYFSAALVIALAVLGFARAGGVSVLPLLILLFGLFLALVVLLDVPLRVIVDETGVERRCLLRHHRLPWDRVMAFGRSSSESGIRRYMKSKKRPSRGEGPNGGNGARSSVAIDKEAKKGGLVVEDVRRRRYLLSLGRERPDEYARLVELVDAYAPGLSMPGPPFYSKRAGRL